MANFTLTTTTALLNTLRTSDDGEVWEQFVARYTPILRAIARRVGLCEEDASDVAQQTLLQFVGGIRVGQYDRSRGRLRSWIVSIAEHRSRDVQRHARGSFLGGLPLDAESDRLATLESWWDEEERAHIAAAAWDELRGSEQVDEKGVQVFELVALRDVPALEAGRQLGMTVGAVYAAKYRIAVRLKAIIERLTSVYEVDLS
jgi:RNA polymerase sigma-70 factor, ECF subfamily